MSFRGTRHLVNLAGRLTPIASAPPDRRLHVIMLMTMTTHPRNRNTLPPLWASARSIPVWALIVATLGSLAIHSAAAQSEPSATGSGAVYVVPITGTIDLGLAPYLSRVLDEVARGRRRGALADRHPGRAARRGAPDAGCPAQQRCPHHRFVDRTASAGGPIAIACEAIYMTPGAVMGAATPVDGATGETATEKIVSAVRTTFKATAEARGRNRARRSWWLTPT